MFFFNLFRIERDERRSTRVGGGEIVSFDGKGKKRKKNLGQLFTTICSLSFETTIEIPSGGNLTSVFQSFRQERTPIGRNRVRQTVQFHLFVEMDDDSPVFPSRNNILDYIDRCSIEKNKGKKKKKKIKRNEFSLRSIEIHRDEKTSSKLAYAMYFKRAIFEFFLAVGRIFSISSKWNDKQISLLTSIPSRFPHLPLHGPFCIPAG